MPSKAKVDVWGLPLAGCGVLCGGGGLGGERARWEAREGENRLRSLREREESDVCVCSKGISTLKIVPLPGSLARRICPFASRM